MQCNIYRALSTSPSLSPAKGNDKIFPRISLLMAAMLSCCQCFVLVLFFFGGGGYSTTWTANEALLMLTVLPLNCFKYIYMDKSSARVWVLKPRLYLISLGLSPCTQGGQLLSTIKVNVSAVSSCYVAFAKLRLSHASLKWFLQVVEHRTVV